MVMIMASNRHPQMDHDLERLPKQEVALKLRSQGKSYAEIGRELGMSTPSAHTLVKKALEERRTVVAELADEVRSLELAHLDELKQAALEILHRTHLATSGTEVVYYDGEPLLDDMQALYAIDRLIKIGKRRAELLGLDSPTVIDTGQMRIEIVGVDTEVLK